MICKYICPVCQEELQYEILKPKDSKNGDLSTNVAIIVSNHFKKHEI